MKKLLISTLTALILVGMVGCNHEVTIKVETPTIETETQEEIQKETEEETQEITEEPCVEEPVVEEPVETYKETQENVQYEYNPDWGYIPALECQFEVLPNGNFRYYKLDETTGKYYIVENPEPVETYEPVKKYKETQENVQYEYNPDWVYDPVGECYVETSQTINEYGSYTNYYKLDETNGKYKKIPSPYNNIYN